MNRKSLKAWEVRLELPQCIVLVGAVTGAMACAFYLGFFSGRQLGLESALQTSQVNLARLPIVPALTDEQIADEVASDVYAKLNADKVLPPAAGAESGKAPDVPDLSTIRKTTIDDGLGLVPAGTEGAGVVEPGPPAESVSAVKGREGEKGKGEAPPAPETLDSILAEREKALEAAKPAEKAPAPEAVAEKKAEEPKRSEEGKKAEAPKAEEPKKAEAPAAALKVDEKKTTSLPRGWFAQVAAPRKHSDATGIAQKLRGSGFPVVVEEANVKGEQYYRILVGPEASKQTADRLVSQLRRERYLEGAPFLRQVK